MSELEEEHAGEAAQDEDFPYAGTLNVVLCFVIAAMSVIFIIDSLNNDAVYYDPLGPGGMPIGIGVAVAGLALFHAALRLERLRGFGGLMTETFAPSARKLWLTAAVIAVYTFVLSLHLLPFVVPTFLALVALGFIVTPERSATLSILIMAAIAAVVAHASFIELFQFNLGR